MAQTIAEYEDANRRYLEDYKAHAITVDMSRDALNVMIPAEVERAMNLTFFGKSQSEVTYDKLKEAVLEYVADQTGTPMDVSAVEAEAQEPVDSLGTSPKGLSKGKIGKGNGDQ